MYPVGFTFLTPILGEFEPGEPFGRDNRYQVGVRSTPWAGPFGRTDQAKALSLAQSVLDHRSAYTSHRGNRVQGKLATPFFAFHFPTNNRKGGDFALCKVAGETGRDDAACGLLASPCDGLATIRRGRAFRGAQGGL
jgi:hypothetical protein